MLAENGIDTVVIERTWSTGRVTPNEFGERIFRSGDVMIFALPDDVDVADVDLDAPPSILVIIADVLAALVALGAVAAWIVLGRRRSTAAA